MTNGQQNNRDAWIEVFTLLGSQGVPSLQHLERILAPGVRFRDPFNDLVGIPALRAVLEHTVQHLRDVQFTVVDSSASGRREYLKWEMSGTLRWLGNWRVVGMSELEFDDDGLLVLHQDYWDASEEFYGRLPVIGWMLRRVRSLASVAPGTS